MVCIEDIIDRVWPDRPSPSRGFPGEILLSQVSPELVPRAVCSEHALEDLPGDRPPGIARLSSRNHECRAARFDGGAVHDPIRRLKIRGERLWASIGGHGD